MSKWRAILLSLVGIAMMPAAAVADVVIDTVAASPNPVQAGAIISVTVDVTLAGGADADWQSTNITLLMVGEPDIELYCGNQPDISNTNGAHQSVFTNLAVPANAAPGDWTVRVRTYDGNDECSDGPPGNNDEGENTSETLTILPPPLFLTKEGTGPSNDYTAAGQTLNYTFTVENTGGSPIPGPVVIDDDLTTNENCPALTTIGNMDGNLDPGETLVCTASYLTVAGDITLNPDSVANCATASADGGAEVSNESCDVLGEDLGIQLDLVLCIDGSTSIDPADWTLQLQGTSVGLDDALNPSFLNGQARLTAIPFSAGASIGVGPTIINSLADLNNFRTALEGLVQPGGTTDQAECITLAHSVLCPGGDLGRGDCATNGVRRIIDISTDGDPTTDNCPGLDNQPCAVFRSDEAEAAGVDVLNVIGVGGGLTVANAVAWAFPEPVQIFDTSMMQFPMQGDEGFVVLVSDFTDYEPAITAKITAELSATFQVNKVWSDSPNATVVEIQLVCDSGMVTVIDGFASEGDPAEFMVDGFTSPVSCDATEVGGPPVGYTQNDADCQDVNIEQEVSCDIVNTLNTAQFTVNKDFSPDNAMGSVMVTLSCGGTTSIDSMNPAMATEAAPAVFDVSGFGAMDTCTATEGTPPVGYTANEDDCQDGLDLANGGSCTIVNTLNTAQFTVNKNFTPDNPAGSVMVTLSCGGTTSIDSANPAVATEAAPAVFNVSGFGAMDTCTATEGTPPVGYTANEDDCQDGQDLANGGSCTIVNTLNTATFTVTKSYNDANMDPVMVTLVCTGNTIVGPPNMLPAAPAAPAMFTVTGFDPMTDTCTATEVEPTGYTWSNPMECLGVGIVEPGGCNLSNVLNRTVFTVTKTYSDGNMDPVSVTLMCTGVNTMIEPPNPAMASPAVPAQFGVTGFDPGVDTCTATEMVPMGYEWTNPADCQAVGLPEPGGCNLNNALIEIDLAKTVDGPPTLEMNGTYTVFYTITATNNGAGASVYDIMDAFSPGSGIALNTAVASYDVGVGENDQSGMLGNFPVSGTIVTGEGLAGGQFETWSVEANFTVDPTMVDPMDRDCTPGQPVMDTGFYNEVSGSATDPNPGNNADCEGLPDPDIDLIKTVTGGPTLEPDGTYSVEYTIEADNLGQGPGYYNLEDTFSPGSGITLNTAMVVYQAGSENNQSGMLGTFPVTTTIVTGEALAAQRNEFWVIDANFNVDPTMVNPADSDCVPGAPAEGTGFYNEVMGVDGETNPANNDTCTGLPDPVIDLAKNITNFVDNGGGSVTVTYQITATNTSDGPGFYDVIDNLAPAAGTTIVSATLTAYVPGTENNQSGTVLGDGVIPEPFTSGQTLVTGEALGGQRSEGFTIVVEFDASNATGNLECGGPGTGTYNEVSGSETDPNLGNNSDCEDLPRLRTSFVVTKDFSDDNPAGVTVEITCNTGLPLMQSGVVHDPAAAGLLPGDFTVIEFIVNDFLPGTMDCDIEEVIPAGYVPDYTAGATTGIADAIFDDANGCHYELIEGGQFTCHIYNELQAVDVIVEKEWIDENPAYQLPLWVDVTLECDGPIVGGFPCNGAMFDGNGGSYCAQQWIDPDNPGVFGVLPHFDGTTCTATEEPITAVLTDESDCEEMVVFPGQGDSCVIVNTRLYAGIPTLNQYGLILLALMMLGIGALAYRRFV